MNNLDDIVAMQKLDKSNMYGSIIELGKQCLHAYEETEMIVVPPDYRDINKILMTGMGGSGLGARIIESVFGLTLQYPLTRLNDYDLPQWVDENTLVVCSSFSGTTEETVENARQAIQRKAKWMAIGTGVDLIDLARESYVPFYKIIPTYNPSKEPRMAIGYSVIGQIRLVAKAGIIRFQKQDLTTLIETMNHVVGTSKREIGIKSNPAKQMAQKFYQKYVVFVTARHLIGAVHTIKNQMNENAKNFSTMFDIPEMNHHILEGFTYPASNKKDLLCILVESPLYPGLIQKRFQITQDILKKNGIETHVWRADSGQPLSEVFEFIQFGALVNFYLAMLNNINPALIPWVDYFKTQLGQSLGQWK
jgi:glucose/mannose-6-phosphate isomerase